MKGINIVIPIFLGLSFLFIPVKWDISGKIDITVVDKNGVPIKGVIIHQEWSRTDMATPKTPESECETLLTDKEGRAILRPRYYYFPVWKILSTYIVGISEYHVNYSLGEGATLTIDGVGSSGGNKNSDVKYTIIYSKCDSDDPTTCFYSCYHNNFTRCELVNTVLSSPKQPKQVVGRQK